MGRRKGTKVSPETRERMRQVWLNKLAAPGGEELRAKLKAQLALANASKPKVPKIPIEQRKLFLKLRIFYRSSARARDELMLMRNT